MTGRFELAGGRRDNVARQFEGSAGGQEVRQLLAQAERAARAILNDNSDRLYRIANALLEHETLTAQELTALGEGRAAPRRAPLQLPGA